MSLSRGIQVAAALIAMPLALSAGKAWADQYGSITYSQSSGTNGYSYNYASQSAAQNAALRECERVSGTGDCEVMVWFKNACGALATAPDGAYGSAWGTNRALAERKAVQSCSQYASGCKVIRWACTDR